MFYIAVSQRSRGQSVRAIFLQFLITISEEVSLKVSRFHAYSYCCTLLFHLLVAVGIRFEVVPRHSRLKRYFAVEGVS
jgi:hypothetical protein